MQTQLSNMEQKLAAASQTEASAKLEISKVIVCLTQPTLDGSVKPYWKTEAACK